ncbi:MAG TPA: DUF6152 family protein [Gammaproteobacteria bacterium]|jgi:hypothetical protein|nr:DUF6152 family protein [Gammaproteobacteria bacterium]
MNDRRYKGVVGAGPFLVWILAVLVPVGPAAAHHSFAVHFVGDKLIKVSGVVDEFSFRNPHGVLVLKTKKDGAEEVWRIETNSPNVLRRRGWSETSIKHGDQVTVEGYPARDGSNSMRVYRVIYPDGHELVGQRPDPGVTSGED